MNFGKSFDGLAIRPFPRGNFVFNGTFTRNAVADFCWEFLSRPNAHRPLVARHSPAQVS